MKKYLKIIPIFLIMFLFLSVSQIQALDNFEILDLDVEINVNEDGTYDIREDYLLNFTSPGLGIYRDLITVQEMQWMIDNKKEVKTYNFPITNINVEGDVFYVESQSKGKRIVIGPDDGPRFVGLKEYRITYTVHSKSLDTSLFKEAFFYNLVSDWTALVHNFQATVNFYDEVDLNKLEVVGTTAYGNIDVNCQQSSKQSFTCTYDDGVVFGHNYGITALVPLADDFFVRPSGNYNYYSGLAFSVLLLLTSFILWIKYGKDDPVIEVVSFNPPQGFNSAMVGYVYDDTVDNDDLYSLLFYWANQGIIEIKESAANVLEFTKLKDLDFDVPYFEKEIFNLMFYKEGPITTKDWQKRDLYSKLLMSKSKVKKAVEKDQALYDRKSLSIKAMLILISSLPLAYTIFKIVKFQLIAQNPAILFAAITYFVNVFIFIIFDQIQSKVRNKKISQILNGIAYLGLTFLIVNFSYFLFNLSYGIQINLFYISIIEISTSVIFILAHYMKKRSAYGSNVYGEVLGLRAFIKYAKKDELIVMQKENPHLYYDVLPYAYAFSMSDLWNEHFKTIEIPQSQYYKSYRSQTWTNYYLMNTLVRSINQVPRQVVPPIQKASGGASFGGGGFSGGGSFSGGGGFGGGGGGGR